MRFANHLQTIILFFIYILHSVTQNWICTNMHANVPTCKDNLIKTEFNYCSFYPTTQVPHGHLLEVVVLIICIVYVK